jgi:hypothetical protein
VLSIYSSNKIDILHIIKITFSRKIKRGQPDPLLNYSAVKGKSAIFLALLIAVVNCL